MLSCPETNTNRSLRNCIIELVAFEMGISSNKKWCLKNTETCPHNSHDVIRLLLYSRNNNTMSSSNRNSIARHSLDVFRLFSNHSHKKLTAFTSFDCCQPLSVSSLTVNMPIEYSRSRNQQLNFHDVATIKYSNRTISACDFFLLLDQTFQHHSRHMIAFFADFFLHRCGKCVRLLVMHTICIISGIKLELVSDKNPRLFDAKIEYSWLVFSLPLSLHLIRSAMLTHKINLSHIQPSYRQQWIFIAHSLFVIASTVNKLCFGLNLRGKMMHRCFKTDVSIESEYFPQNVNLLAAGSDRFEHPQSCRKTISQAFYCF